MRRFVDKHKHKIIAGHGIIIVAVLMSTSFLFDTSTTTVIFFTPEISGTLRPDEITKIDVNLNTNVPIDATGATIKFSQDLFTVVGISKEKSFFDLWTEETTIREGLGEIVFSGGTTARTGHVGTGTIMTLTLKAKKEGDAMLSFDNVRVFPHDGTGRPVKHEARSLAYTIATTQATGGTAPQQGVEPSQQAQTESKVSKPEADLTGDGKVTISDLSILMVGILSSYNPRYDFNTDGNVSLTDLSILLAQF